MLKHSDNTTSPPDRRPAAFGRLCVETRPILNLPVNMKVPAAFGRLCVETATLLGAKQFKGPAAFGRLCVETVRINRGLSVSLPSRLRAAVC